MSETKKAELTRGGLREWIETSRTATCNPRNAGELECKNCEKRENRKSQLGRQTRKSVRLTLLSSFDRYVRDIRSSLARSQLCVCSKNQNKTKSARKLSLDGRKWNGLETYWFDFAAYSRAPVSCSGNWGYWSEGKEGNRKRSERLLCWIEKCSAVRPLRPKRQRPEPERRRLMKRVMTWD